MSKGFKGFLIGLFVLVVGFALTVLIMGSVNGRNFIEEIKSWGDTVQEETVTPEDETPSEDETEIETPTTEETQTTAVITIMSNDNFKIAL